LGVARGRSGLRTIRSAYQADDSQIASSNLEIENYLRKALDEVHTMLDCLLIADDLTGACDAAAPFAALGWPVAVVLAPNAVPETVRVLAVSTGTRDAAPPEIRSAMARIPFRSARLHFKKIDSTLRGDVAEEIAAALDAFDLDAAAVCPAFPRMRRTVEGGFLRVAGADVSLVAARLRSIHCAVGGLGAAINGGARVVSLDAACDADLDRLAAAILALGRPVLWAGSAGLAAALARALCTRSAGPAPSVRRGSILFCIGSDHPVALEQERILLETRRCIQLDAGSGRDCLTSALSAGLHVVLRFPRGRVELGALRDLLFGAPAAALALSGGDTAALVCRAAAVERIDILEELMPGIPRGVLRCGMFDGTAVVTKSGGFGAPDALVRIADYFYAPGR
jgi:D-threonate/D-erythronate kinase